MTGRPVVLVAAAVMALLAAAAAGSGFLLRFAAEALLLGTAAMALDLVLGFGGIVTLGQAVPFGLAAYVAALLAGPLGGEALPVLLAGAGAGAVAGGATGVLVARSSALHATVLTLLAGQVAAEVASHWRTVTGGTDGLRGLPFLHLGSMVLGEPRALFLLAGGLALGAFLLLRSFVAAPAGRALVATRDAPLRAGALGYGVAGIRLGAMALSGAVAGAAGALHPFVTSFVGPDTVGWEFSASLVIILVIGGTGTLWGALPGAFAVLGARNFVGAYTDHWQAFVGLLFVATVLLLPGGVAGGMAGMGRHRGKGRAG